MMNQVQSITLWVVFAVIILNLFLALWLGGNWVVSLIINSATRTCPTCRKTHRDKLALCQHCLRQGWWKDAFRRS